MGYRILSLDGGGAWALIEVRALIDLYDENTTRHQVLADFDLAVLPHPPSLRERHSGGTKSSAPLSPPS
jgi:hypothetical protein